MLVTILVIMLVTLADIILLIKILAAIMLVNLVVPERIELSFSANQADVIPLYYGTIVFTSFQFW